MNAEMVLVGLMVCQHNLCIHAHPNYQALVRLSCLVIHKVRNFSARITDNGMRNFNHCVKIIIEYLVLLYIYVIVSFIGGKFAWCI